MPKIIIAHTGRPHISADDVGALIKAITGDNDYLLSDVPETFGASLLENNTVQLSEAEIVMQGTHIRIQASDQVVIEQGQNNMKRIDLIVCRYSKDDDGIEKAEIAVVKGAPSTSPTVPIIEQGDIRNGATLREMPLFKVEIEGFAITAIKNICQTVNSLYTTLQSIVGLQRTVENHSTALDTTEKNIKSVTETADSNKAKLNSIFANNLLWTGAYYMNEKHSISIPSIAKQPNGIILVFSRYVDGAAEDYYWHSFVVPKYLVATKSGRGHTFTMTTPTLGYFTSKYLYITDEKITGSKDNTAKGTGLSGVKYDNSNFVLRYVLSF